jgi:hypothetical protein
VRLDVEADVVHRAIDMVADAEVGLQVVDGQHRFFVCCRRLSRSLSRNFGHRRRARQGTGLEARVEQIADAVAQQVDAHDHQEDHHTGDDRDVRRGDQQLAPFAEHRTEVRVGRLRAETEEGEARGLQDHPADGGGDGDDDDRQHVGQHLGQQDAEVRLAGQARRIDELAPGEAESDAAYVAREEGDVDDGDGEEGVQQARPQRRAAPKAANWLRRKRESGEGRPERRRAACGALPAAVCEELI